MSKNAVLVRKRSEGSLNKMKKSRSSFIDLNVDNTDANSLKDFEELEQNVRANEEMTTAEK
jgi:hypothetical protein